MANIKKAKYTITVEGTVGKETVIGLDYRKDGELSTRRINAYIVPSNKERRERKYGIKLIPFAFKVEKIDQNLKFQKEKTEHNEFWSVEAPNFKIQCFNYDGIDKEDDAVIEVMVF